MKLVNQIDQIQLTRLGAETEAGLLMASLPWPKEAMVPVSLGQSRTAVFPLGQWPGQGMNPRRLLMIADGHNRAPDHLQLGGGVEESPLELPDAVMELIESSPHAEYTWERHLLRLRKGGRSIGLAMGLRTGGEVHWWEACRLVELERTPECVVVEMGGVIPRRVMSIEEFHANVGYRNPYLHKHNWVSGHIYARLHANGVCEVFAHHINNRFFDDGEELADVVPVIGFDTADGGGLLGEWDGTKGEFALDGVSFDMRETARLARPEQPGSVTRDGRFLVLQPYEGVEMYGGICARERTGDPYIFHGNTRTFPRGMARTLRFSLSLTGRSPRIARYLAPAWWYGVCEEFFPDSLLPVSDQYDAWQERALDWAQEHIIRGGFEDGLLPRGISMPHPSKGRVRHEPSWEGEAPYGQFLGAWRSGREEDYDAAMRASYYFTDVSVDHAIKSVRMHGYPPNAIALPMNRMLCTIAAYLETGDPYLRDAAEAVIANSHWLHRNSWPRLAVGRDSCYIRGAMMLYRYLGEDFYRKIALEACLDLCHSQRENGSFGDQGGGAGIHQWAGYISKPWMGLLAINGLIDYLQVFPGQQPLQDAVIRFADWMMTVRRESGGSLGWPYQHDYNGTNRHFTVQTGEWTELPGEGHWYMDSIARLMTFATLVSGESRYFEAWEETRATSKFENGDHSTAATLQFMPWVQAKLWNARLTENGVSIAPVGFGARIDPEARISTAEGWKPARSLIGSTAPHSNIRPRVKTGFQRAATRVIVALLLGVGISLAAESWTTGGEVSRDGDRFIFAGKRDAHADIPLLPGSDQTIGMRLSGGTGTTTFGLWVDGKELGRFTVAKDKTGDALSGRSLEWDAETGKWKPAGGEAISLPYRPGEKATAAWKNLEAKGLKPTGWADRELGMRLVRRDRSVEVYLDGVLLLAQDVSSSSSAFLRASLTAGDVLRPVEACSASGNARFVPLDIRGYAPGGTIAPTRETVSNGIPFLRPRDDGAVDLRKAEWPFAREQPSSYFAAYDSGPMFLHDQRTPTFWAPTDDYVALHLWVRAAPTSGKSSDLFSIRTGYFGTGALGGRGQVLQHDYHANVPGKGGEQLVSVPLTEAVAQDLLQPALQIGLNKEIRLARRSPDPSRFEFRPLGLPPGVEILGATLERAPVRMRVTAAEPGQVFEGEKKADFKVQLENTTAEKQDYVLESSAWNPEGQKIQESRKGTLKPGEKQDLNLPIVAERWGYYDLTIDLNAGGKNLRRKTSFALLPPDTRRHRAESPFGTWTYSTPSQPDLLGSLLKKAGLRFGMGQFPEERGKWGVQNNFETKAITSPDKYENFVKKNPDSIPAALLMHEHSISADHVSRVPDAFTGRKPYALSEDEKKRFQTLWDEQVAMARLMREKFPKVHLRLGNGPLPTKEEFLRNKFPAELFDSLGNEAGSFGRPPEAQPPDWVGNNAGLWMDHQLLKTYGYDKPVSQCYEVIYPSTNPGNLTSLDQAAYFVRHGLHSVTWGMKEIRFGLLEDVVSAYRFSNWGASGLMHAPPHSRPKPAFVAVATLTRMLDGAKFQRTLETGTPSVYAAEFSQGDDQRVYAFWTLRGERPISLAVSGGDWIWTDWEGNPIAAKAENGRLSATLNSMPIYLTGRGTVEGVVPGEPHYAEKPSETAKPIAKLNSLDSWTIGSGADPVLEFYNPLTPRRLGSFDFSAEENALRVKASKTTGAPWVPMYGALQAKTPLELPGEPSEIGLWVEGNSGWGRVIYELEDASGQKWTSIGASRKGEVSEWMLDWLPAEFAKSDKQAVSQADWNTNDVFGLSAINFDGWRYVRFPLPGNYTGENNPWPANSQWRSDKDGVVHYPLKLTRLIFEFPENILKLAEAKQVENQAVRVKDLMVEFGTQGGSKQGVYEDEN